MIPEDYFIVHKSIVPGFFGKVLQAKKLIESGAETNISTAVKKCGISRSTYYKYKDGIIETSTVQYGRKAVLDMMLSHETGVLSAVLSAVSKAGASVLTITQSLPVNGKANLTLSIDVCKLQISIEILLSTISELKGVENPRIVAIE